MRVNGVPTRTIWADSQAARVFIIDQTLLPHRYEIAMLASVADAVRAISDMLVRGAPLIGAAAAYGVALAMASDARDDSLDSACARLAATRPTAVNLRWALGEMRAALAALPVSARRDAAFDHAARIADEDVARNAAIGDHGLALLRSLAERKAGRLNILTHCNAGWLATVDWGTATAPIYKAHDSGLDLHVFVDETRPRNQGASLTAWELAQHGVPHTLIVDNAGGHLMQQGDIDVVIVGADRVTANGDVCNKIGTYLKALAAHDNGIPFYAAVPSPTMDFTLASGKDIPIEERGAREVTHLSGETEDGRIETILIAPTATPAANPAFDVTPARLVTGLITERGVIAAETSALAAVFPDLARG